MYTCPICFEQVGNSHICRRLGKAEVVLTREEPRVVVEEGTQ